MPLFFHIHRSISEFFIMKTLCPGVCVALSLLALSKNFLPFSAMTFSSLILWVIFLTHCLYSLLLEETDTFGSISYALTFVSCFLTLCAFPLFSGRILQLNLYTNLLFICMCMCVFLLFPNPLINVFYKVCLCHGLCVYLLILNGNLHTRQLLAPVFLCLRAFSCLWSSRCC